MAIWLHAEYNFECCKCSSDKSEDHFTKTTFGSCTMTRPATVISLYGSDLSLEHFKDHILKNPDLHRIVLHVFLHYTLSYL